MIPKKLVSCWFGRSAKNALFVRCREAKERFFPRGEWEWIDVDEDNCGALMQAPYMKAVHERGEFVKCTELARIWALAMHGGVYLDEDVEPIRSFDPLLAHVHSDGKPLRFFAARERAKPGEAAQVNGAVLGSTPDNAIINALWDNFPSLSDGRGSPLDFGPRYLTKQVDSLLKAETPLGGALLVPDTFYPTRFDEDLSPDEAIARAVPGITFAVHHWMASWLVDRGAVFV